MTPERLAEIREKNARSTAYLATELDAAFMATTAYGHCAELLAALDESYEAYEKLSVIAGRVDFDRSESAVPETQDGWIEFIREIQDALEGLVAPWDLGTVHDRTAVPSGTEEASEGE